MDDPRTLPTIMGILAYFALSSALVIAFMMFRNLLNKQTKDIKDDSHDHY